MSREGSVKELGSFCLGKGRVRRCFKYRKGCDGDLGLCRQNEKCLQSGQRQSGLDGGKHLYRSCQDSKNQCQRCTGGIWQGKSARRARAGLGSTVSLPHAPSTCPLPPSPLKTHVSFDSGNEKTLGNSCLVSRHRR